MHTWVRDRRVDNSWGGEGISAMPKTRSPYAAEFRQQMVDLVRSGRAPEDLAREFEPSSQAIRTWVAQAAEMRVSAATGCGRRSVTSCADCAGRTGACAKSERYWQKQRPGSRGRPDPGDLPVHERESGSFPRRHDGPSVRRLPERVLRVALSSAVGSGTGRCRAPGSRPGDSRPQSRDVWCSSDSRRADRGRCRGEPQAGHPGYAVRRRRRGEPAPRPSHDTPECPGPPGPGSGRAALRGGRAEPALGRRHHLRPDPGRLPVPGHRPRRVQPARRRLGHGGASSHRAGG